MPYRIPAPPEPELPDAPDPYLAVLRAAARRTRLGAFAACVAALALVRVVGAGHASSGGVEAVRRADAQRAAELRERASAAISEARARLAAEQARFEVAMRGAVAEDNATATAADGDAVDPSGDRACPIALPRPTSALTGARPFPLLVVRRGEVNGDLPSQAIAGALADVGRAEQHLAAGRYESAAFYAARSSTNDLGADVVLVATRWDEPRVLRDDAFLPGAIDGRAYLFDHGTGRVACEGDVHVTNAPSVGYAYLTASASRSDRLAQSLEDDLRLETARAVADAVRARPPRQ